MNETSMTASDAGSPSVAGSRWRAFTRSWTITRGSPAERCGELAATDVDGVDARGAALEQDVREPARGRARVEADEAGRVDAERVERARQLLAAARDVGQGRRDLERHRAVDEVPGLAIESRRIARPDPHAAGQQQRLGPAPRLDEAALHEQLVQPDARRDAAVAARAAPAGADRAIQRGRQCSPRDHATHRCTPAHPGAWRIRARWRIRRRSAARAL